MITHSYTGRDRPKRSLIIIVYYTSVSISSFVDQVKTTNPRINITHMNRMTKHLIVNGLKVMDVLPVSSTISSASSDDQRIYLSITYAIANEEKRINR